MPGEGKTYERSDHTSHMTQSIFDRMVIGLILSGIDSHVRLRYREVNDYVDDEYNPYIKSDYNSKRYYYTSEEDKEDKILDCEKDWRMVKGG